LRRNEEEKPQKARSFEERSWALLAEMWQQREADEIMRQLEADRAAGKTEAMDAFFAKYDARNYRLMEREISRSERRRFLRQTLPRTIRAASVFLVCFLFAGGVTVAASSTARVYLMKLLVDVQQEYTSFMVVEDKNEYIDVPAEWGGEYYPARIPEGLVLNRINSEEGMIHEVTFTSPDSSLWQFIYRELEKGGLITDTEDAVITSAIVHGHEATVVSEGSRVKIYWFDGTKLYTIGVRNCSVEEALEYANAIQKLT